MMGKNKEKKREKEKEGSRCTWVVEKKKRKKKKILPVQEGEMNKMGKKGILKVVKKVNK